MATVQSFTGPLVLIFMAWLAGENRNRVSLKQYMSVFSAIVSGSLIDQPANFGSLGIMIGAAVEVFYP